MPRPRFDRLDPDKRRRILAVAAEEFAARGVGNASLNRIIDHAGISKGAAYYYFDDKADLFATVIREGMESFRPPPARRSTSTLSTRRRSGRRCSPRIAGCSTASASSPG